MCGNAFLTGIDLEGRCQKEDVKDEGTDDEEPTRLALPAPCAPSKRRSLELLDRPAPEGRSVEYSSLLQDALALHDEDPLEELRRLIKRTRAKMDSQTKVMDGFIEDVNQIRGLGRSCSSSGLKAIAARQAAPALADKPARAELRKPLQAGTLSTSSLSIVRPSSASSDFRSKPKRSASTPALLLDRPRPSPAAAAALDLHDIGTPLVLPARRAPPGSVACRPRLPEALVAARKATAAGLPSLSSKRSQIKLEF